MATQRLSAAQQHRAFISRLAGWLRHWRRGPQRFDLADLSAHLQRDVGLCDGRAGVPSGLTQAGGRLERLW